MCAYIFPYPLLVQSACVCVCVCVFFPSILDIKFVGRTSRGHTGGRSHRICGRLMFTSNDNATGVTAPRSCTSKLIDYSTVLVFYPSEQPSLE